MTHGSHYLGKLYNDLIANSPQTISIDIPSDMGKGRIAQTQIKHGIIFSDWQMCYQSDMNVQGTVSKDYMQIIFCLNDAISWGIMDEKRSITIQKNESCIYAGHGGTEYACYKKDSNFSFKSIKIPIAYFSQLLTDYFDGQEATAYEKKLLDGISKVPVTPIMEQILAETSQFTQYRGGLGYLYLDGKLLELLSIYLGEVLELDILMGKNVSMSRTERTAIMEAKRIIDSQLAFAPSCEELSHLVHLSTTKLTRGFSSFYGMPIHQYIIEQRLTQAAQLLLEGDRNVSEIAAIVGYGKPSNLAAAFKKRPVSAFHIRSRRIEISRFLGIQLSVLIRPVHIIGQDAHDAAIVVHGGCHVILSVLVGLLGHFPAAPGHGNAAVVQHVIFHSRLQTVAIASRRGNLGFFHHAVHHRHGDAGQRQDNGNHHKQFNQRESLGLTVQKRCLHTLPRVAQLQFRASGKQPAPPISKPVPGTAADGITPVHKHPGAFRQPGCLKRMLL